MEAWQERVVAEKRELDSKLVKLTGFLAFQGVDFKALSATDQGLLHSQHAAMTMYSNVLKLRIDRF